MSTAARDLLGRQLEAAYELIRRRVEGLTDEEFWWEPVPDAWTVRLGRDGRWSADYEEPDPEPAPFTTITWRLVHVAECKLMYHEYAFGPGKLIWPDLASPHTAGDGVTALEEGHTLLTDDLDGPRGRRSGRAPDDQLGGGEARVVDLLDHDRARRPPWRRDRRPPRPVPPAIEPLR